MTRLDVYAGEWSAGARPGDGPEPAAGRAAPDPGRREFEETALPHLDALYNMALKLTRDRSGAEDLVQDTFVRAYRFFSRYERGTNCKAWLFKILRNAFINRYRKLRRTPEEIDFSSIEGHSEALVAGDRDPGAASPERTVGDLRMGEEVRSMLDRLPPDFRMVVVLAFVEGYTYKEISEIMSCPIGTVMSRLFRARKILQEGLERHARERGLVRRRASGRPGGRLQEAAPPPAR